jgi:hypothetical protein
MHGARPPPFTISTITYKVVVYAPGQIQSSYFYSIPIYVQYGTLWEEGPLEGWALNSCT